MFKTPLHTYNYIWGCENPYVSAKAFGLVNKDANAIDIAIFISLGLAVSIPHLGGLGGDFFSIVYDRDFEEIKVVMASGYSGKFSSIDLFRSLGYEDMPRFGPGSITIPGLVDGLNILWKKYGSMDWGDIINYLIELIEDGFPLSRTLRDSVAKLVENGGVDDYFMKIFGGIKDLDVGDRVRFPSVVKLLKLIGEDPRNFYEGDPVQRFLDVLNRDYKLFDEGDFKDYHAYITDPLRISYKGWEVFEAPLNSLGLSTLQLLMLDQESGFTPPPLSLERIEYYLNLFKVVYYIREKFLGDPRYLKVSMEKLMDLDYINSLAKDIGVSTGSFDGDTTYFCVADDRYLIGCIQSLFHPFGSRVVDPYYGVVFNNRGSSFTFDESVVNCLAPNKYPLHTLSTPLLKRDGKSFVLGLSAGIYRPQLHLQLITNLVDYGFYPQDAIEFPRFIWDPSNDYVKYEDKYDVNGSKFRGSSVPYGSRIGVGSILMVRKDLLGVYPDIRGEVFPCGW